MNLHISHMVLKIKKKLMLAQELLNIGCYSEINGCARALVIINNFDARSMYEIHIRYHQAVQA